MSETLSGLVRPTAHIRSTASNWYTLPLNRSYRNRWQGSFSNGARVLRGQRPFKGHIKPSNPHFAVKAVAAPEAPDVTAFQKDFPLGSSHSITVVVEDWKDNTQVVVLATDRPGRLLLHWGVEGGKDYKGGWVLPGPEAHPPGTVNYKNRALQTPFMPVTGGKQELKLEFRGEVPFDYLNFVIKDESTGTWYDLYASNFHIPLHRAVTLSVAGSIDELPQLSEDEIPLPPDELCGIWAYIKWEAAGCPNRSQEESDKEYREGIQELKQLLRLGVPLEQLWKVARGEVRYDDYVKQTIAAKLDHSATAAPKEKKAAPASAAPPLPPIPQELVNIEAYLLWEKAGRPEGADFSSDARKMLEAQLQSGKTIADLERILKAPPQAAAPQAPAPPPPPAASTNGSNGNGAGPAVVEKKKSLERKGSIRFSEVQFDRAPSIKLGDPIGKASRNPLDLIKSNEPLLVREKRKAAARPLGDLEDAAARDESCVWHRAFPLGSKLELLVAVRQQGGKDGPVTVTLTTDLPGDVYLHWGVRKGSKDAWILPSKDFIPASSLAAEDGAIAIDTPFSSCKDSDCQVTLAGDPVPLPAHHHQHPQGSRPGWPVVCTALSGDRSMWWRDGGRNFNVPVPGGATPLPQEDVCAFQDELSCEIVHCETKADQWTLMHRYNKAADLIEALLQGEMNDDAADGMARIFVWLRYSASRQLTWQRNYNTQPRILGEAQRRLTHAISDAHQQDRRGSPGVGAGHLAPSGVAGMPKRWRDESLNIMHRNHIPEKRGNLDGGLAPEATQQHDAGRRGHL
eukprot:jgi/Botrbrau1/21926/Bobra.0249s0050.1